LAILQVILFYFVNYTLATVAAHLAGTVFAHICGVLVLNFIAFFTYMVHYMLSDIFFATFVGDSQSRLLLRLSPYIRTFSILNEPLTLFEGGLYAVFTALLIGGCLWLYQRRPSEKSGTPLIFDCSKPVFKYLIVLWGTAYMGLFFYAISGIGFMLFGFVAGGFLTHMACEVVFQKDFKSMLKNKLGLLAFLAAFGVVFCVYYFDMTGFDTYIPNEASVESITFTDGLENSYYYTTGPNAKMKEPYSDPEEMASILQIARLSVEYREQNQTTDGLGRRQAAPVALSQKYAANNLNITISYQLKSGRNVQRRYTSVPLVVVKEPFEGLYNTRRYIENSSSLFLRDETYPLSRMEITSTINKSEAKYLERDKNTLTEEQSRKLMEAMKQDALKRTFADMQTYHQVFMVTTSYEVKDQNGRQQYYANAEIPVYENDAATIAVLTRDFGMRDPKETYQVLLSSIGQIELYRYEDLNAAEYVQKAKAGILDQESTIAPVVILDPAQIAEIMDCSILAGRYRNTVALTDGSISAVIVMKNGASSEAMSYYDYNNDKNQGGYRLSLLIRQDKLPSFAEALLNR
jgi:hypothetical protein